MQLVMAVSRDGFIAKNDHDSMSWITDLQEYIIYSLTIQGNRMCGIHEMNIEYMPRILEGRKIIQLSETGICIRSFDKLFPNSVLLCSPLLMDFAIKTRIVNAIHLIKGAVDIGLGLNNDISNRLMEVSRHPGLSNWKLLNKKSFPKICNDTTLETWVDLNKQEI